MNSKDITKAVVRDFYDPRKWAVCPNVSHSVLLWEADILAVSEAGRIHEVEVKVTRSDLRADKKKWKWKNDMYHIRDRIDSYFLAVPEEIEVEASVWACEIGAGLYVVRQAEGDRSRAQKTGRCLWPRKKKEDRRHDITAEALHRLCSLRYWDDLMGVGAKSSYREMKAKQKDKMETAR